MSTRTLVILIAFVVIIGLIAANNQQKWVSLHMPRAASNQVAPEKTKPWITKGDVIWTGTTKNNLLQVELISLQTIDHPTSILVPTQFRITWTAPRHVACGAVVNQANTGGAHVSNFLAIRLHDIAVGRDVYDTVEILPDIISHAKGIVHVGNPEIPFF